MNLECKLIEKAFTDKEGISRNYFALEFPLVDGSKLDVTIKGDKAKLLKMSYNLEKEDKMPELY